MDICDVCGKEVKETFVCASTMGAISFGYCEECLRQGLEPYSAVVAYISCAGRFPDDINETYQKHVKNILKCLNISEEQFIKDVNKSIKKMDEYYSNIGELE